MLLRSTTKGRSDAIDRRSGEMVGKGASSLRSKISTDSQISTKANMSLMQELGMRLRERRKKEEEKKDSFREGDGLSQRESTNTCKPYSELVAKLTGQQEPGEIGTDKPSIKQKKTTLNFLTEIQAKARAMIGDDKLDI